MDKVQEQIHRLEGTITKQEAEVRELELQVEELRREIVPFIKEYDRVVQNVYDRVEAVREAINEFEEIKRKSSNRYGVDAKKVWEAVAEATSIPPFSERVEDKPLEPLKPTSKPRADQSLKQLYRKLARRFHPDLAENDADRAHRNHIMTLINEAYSNRDLEALLTLDEDGGGTNQDTDDQRVEVPLSVIKLRKLQQESVGLANRIQDLKIEHHDLMYGQMMDLKIQCKFAKAKGRNLLREMANDLQQEYWKLTKRLDKLRNGVN